MWISVPTILPSHRVFSLLPEGAVNSADLFCSRNGLVLFGDFFFPLKADRAEKFKPFLHLTVRNGGNISVIS